MCSSIGFSENKVSVLVSRLTFSVMLAVVVPVTFFVTFLVVFASPSFASVSFTSSGRYYDQFLFRASGSCQQPTTLWFQSLSIHEEPILGRASNGREIQVDLSLHVFENGTYWGLYTENEVIGRNTNGGLTEPLLEKPLQGRWKVSNGRISFENLGEGRPLHVENEPEIGEGSESKILFVFRKAVHDPRLVGQTVVLGKTFTSVGPRGESVQQYCRQARRR